MALRYSVAEAVTSTAAPPIPKARKWAAEYKAQTELLSSIGPLLDLSQGVPKHPPHHSFTDRLTQLAADPESSRYGAIRGEPALRDALAEEINQLYRLPSHEIDREHLAITTGCNMAFLTILMALCPPGDSSILIPLPTYFNHSMSMNLQSITPIYIPSDPASAFLPDIATARKYLDGVINPATGELRSNVEKVRPRMIVLTTPSNPTGTVYPHAVLKEWYDLAKEYSVALVLDETYREFVDGEAGKEEMGLPHRLFEEKDWRETLITVGSFSKGYRIPGHRLGNIIGSPTLLQHIETICDCMQICPPRLPQLALTPLLPILRSDLLASSVALSNRRTLFQETIEAIPGWKVVAKGGYYAYVEFPLEYTTASSALGLKRKQLSSEDIARVLATKCGVVVLPGGFFMPDLTEEHGWDHVIGGGEILRQDRWLRFAVANVEDQDVVALGPRLRKMNEIMGVDQ